MGTLLPGVGNTIPSRWESYSHIVGNKVPAQPGMSCPTSDRSPGAMTGRSSLDVKDTGKEPLQAGRLSFVRGTSSYTRQGTPRLK